MNEVSQATPAQHATMRARRGKQRSEEGAAMLIVLLVILTVTASAMFAMHAAAFEVRGSGNARVATQAYYVADTGMTQAQAWVDARSPATLLRLVQLSEQQAPLNLQPFEPAIEAGRGAYRLDGQDLAGIGQAPLDQSHLGSRQAYAPRFLVDVYDVHVYTGVIPGQRSDGNTGTQYLRATYTSRGRMDIVGGDFRDAARDSRNYHEGARDMRSEALSGPFGGSN